MCGVGTILIERARAARYRLLLGGDIASEAVDATLANVGRKYKPVQIRRWDARNLPLADASVSAILTNMPFGRQIGTVEDNRTLYPALIREWARILAPGGRMVLLTGDRQLLARSLRPFPHLVARRPVQILVRGYRASLIVIHSEEMQ
jgi:tRNA G10  N-methylase Trm11